MKISDRSFFLDVSKLKNNIHSFGQYSKTYLFPTKTYLSFNRSGEWNIRILNVVQLFLRNFFGWYEDTHLRTVAIAWNDYQSTHGNVCPALSKKITELWAKKNTTPILKEPSEVFIFGNSIPSNAAIIGICQLHSDLNEAKFTAKIIAENYREGDVILVEGIDADKVVRANEVPQTMLFPKNAEIHGWEPVGFQELSNFVFEPIISIIKEFESQAAIFINLMNNINFVKKQLDLIPSDSCKEIVTYSATKKNSYWEDCLKWATEGCIKAVGKIDARFRQIDSSSNHDATQKKDRIAERLNLFLAEYKSFALSAKGNEEVKKLLSIFSELYEVCNACITQNKYKIEWTQAQNNFFINTWSKRQESLANEIHKNLELQKRIIICAGAALFFPKRGTEYSDSLNAIRGHKYSLVIQNNESNATFYSFADLANRYDRQLKSINCNNLKYVATRKSMA